MALESLDISKLICTEFGIHFVLPPKTSHDEKSQLMIQILGEVHQLPRKTLRYFYLIRKFFLAFSKGDGNLNVFKEVDEKSLVRVVESLLKCQNLNKQIVDRVFNKIRDRCNNESLLEAKSLPDKCAAQIASHTDKTHNSYYGSIFEGCEDSFCSRYFKQFGDMSDLKQRTNRLSPLTEDSYHQAIQILFPSNDPMAKRGQFSQF